MYISIKGILYSGRVRCIPIVLFMYIGSADLSKGGLPHKVCVYFLFIFSFK